MSVLCFRLELCVWPLHFLITFIALVGSFIKPDFNVFLSFIAFFVLKTGNVEQFFCLAMFYGISLISDIVWLSANTSIQKWTYAQQAHEFALTCSICVFILKILFSIILLILSKYWNDSIKIYFQQS